MDTSGSTYRRSLEDVVTCFLEYSVYVLYGITSLLINVIVVFIKIYDKLIQFKSFHNVVPGLKEAQKPMFVGTRSE